MRIFAALLFVVVFPAAAQRVEVPSKMEVAGITLIIRDDARREIQKDVDALTASPRHYQIKAERAKTYFPIIEKIFREEGVPDDLKYLVLQESALIPDAVSSSNAVGFWQFKDFTAIEMGLRVDRDIDERLNIASSSRAAARYLTKNNQHFDNWIYALQAYQMGAGGVMKSVKDTEAGAKRMEITGKTYWYVKKFLAHKIAYEGSVAGTPRAQVVVFENRGHRTLKQLASETMVDEEALRELNKWARKGVIPDDRTYVVLLPVEGVASDVVLADANVGPRVDSRVAATSPATTKSARGKVNGVSTIVAKPGDDIRRLAARAGVDVPKLLKWNDMKKGDPIVAGQEYFLAKKRARGSEDFHKLSEGESLWAVSQRYGVQLAKVERYNRLEQGQRPPAGTMLYLASRRPKETTELTRVADPVEVSNGETFTWAVKSEPVASEVVISPPAIEVKEEVGPVSTIEIREEVAPVSVIEVKEQPVSASTTKPADSVEILQTNKSDATLEDSPQPVPANKQHTVAPKETLYGIARTYGVSVMELVEWNNLDLQQGIRPGQVLKLSSGEETAKADVASTEAFTKEEFFHEVKTSDTLYGIARKYNVTIKEIMEWNAKKDFSLAVGEKLRILRNQ